MKKRTPLFLIVILGTLLMLILLLSQHMLREHSTIVLPEHPTESDNSTGNSGTEDLNVLSITPDTVQTAIATLSRPSSYRRTQTITLYWDGGESTTTAQIAVSGSATRIDTTLSDGSICHTLLNGNRFAIWYDEETSWTVLNTDQISADALQRIPTYETALELPADRIGHAEYCKKDDVFCIYLRTLPDAEGYAVSYWISVESGLLFAAERTCGDDVIYRFSATEPDKDPPAATAFLLPDGSQL